MNFGEKDKLTMNFEEKIEKWHKKTAFEASDPKLFFAMNDNYQKAVVKILKYGLTPSKRAHTNVKTIRDSLLKLDIELPEGAINGAMAKAGFELASMKDINNFAWYVKGDSFLLNLNADQDRLINVFYQLGCENETK